MDSAVRKGEAFDPTLYNEDLAPIPKERHNWSWVNYSTVWMGIVHNVVVYTTAAGLVAANRFLILAIWVNSIAEAESALEIAEELS